MASRQSLPRNLIPSSADRALSKYEIYDQVNRTLHVSRMNSY